jgi:hypothetical protein
MVSFASAKNTKRIKNEWQERISRIATFTQSRDNIEGLGC